MKNVVLLFVLIFVSLTINAQINVSQMSQPTILVGNADLGNTNLNYIEGANILINTTQGQGYTQIENKTINAFNKIEISNYANITPPATDKQLVFSIDGGNPDVFCFSHTSLTDIKSYEKFEVGITLPNEIEASINNYFLTEDSNLYLNPFLQWDIQVKAKFTHKASGFIKLLDGFYSKDYERHVVDETWNELTTSQSFRIRYGFPERYGIWNVKIELWVNGSIYTQYLPFEVQVSQNPDNKGFVKVGANKKTLALKDDLFFPIGQNFIAPSQIKLCSYSINPCGSDVFDGFDENLDAFAINGSNSYRIILSPPSLDIEFEKIGNYRDRLNYAWELDNIIKKAEEKDLYIDLSMLIQYGFIKRGPYHQYPWDWSNLPEPGFDATASQQMNCYGKDLELDHPKYFLSDARAKKFYKQKLRYLINRYGYSTSIYLLELVSEINSVGDEFDVIFIPPDSIDYKHASNVFLKSEYASPDPLISEPHIQNTYLWQKEMAEYIKHGLGHTEHLISCSYAGTPDYRDQTFGIPEIDVISYNHYQYGQLNFMNYFIDEIKYYWDTYQKPIFFSETGTLSEDDCDHGLTYKQNVWQLPFSGLAGFNMWKGDNPKTNPNSVSHWQELRKVQNWIMSDPEMVYALQHNFTAHNVSSTPFTEHYSLKEMNFIIGAQPNGDCHKYFGALLNLTDNYFTNATDTASYCRKTVNNEENVIINKNLTQFQSKQSLSFGDQILDPSQVFHSEFIEFDWYKSDNLTYLTTFGQDWYFYNDFFFKHPYMCLEGTCLDNYPYSSILPFRSSFCERSELRQYISTNDEDYQEVVGKELRIVEDKTPQLIIQPNPGKDEVFVASLETHSANARYCLVDACGRILRQEIATTKPTIFDVQTLIPGVYYIQLQVNQQIIKTEKWLKSAY